LRKGPASGFALLLTGCLLPAPGATPGAETPKLEWLDDFKVPLWYEDVSVRGSFGYKDNVVLRSSHPLGSAFWAGGADLLVYRLPTSGWRFNAFASFDHVGYLNKSTGVSDEEIAMAMAQLTKDLDQGWKTGLGVNYMFQHQVFDVSVTQTNQFTNGEVLGHNAGGRWFVRKDFKPYWIEAEANGGRQWLAAPLDSLWQAGPRLTLGRAYSGGSELSLSYLWAYVAFDTREQVTAAGYTVPNTHLRFQAQSVELAWHQVWDAQRRWHTVTKAGLDLNQDNGSGYFDFWQYRLAEQVKYRAKSWEISAQVRVGWYDFTVQPISPTVAALRQKTLIGAVVRVEKSLGKAFKVFASYAFDRSLSNVTTDRYEGNAFSAGAEYRF
jgi:hypothetical protein